MITAISYIKKLLSLVPPKTPTYPPVTELDRTIDDINFHDLVLAVKKYTKKNISPTHNYLGINYVNHTVIEVITTSLDYSNSRHGYGSSQVIISKLMVNIKELGF